MKNQIALILWISTLFLFGSCQQQARTEASIQNQVEARPKTAPNLEYFVRASNLTDSKPAALILLHGYRSNAKNFFSLAQHFPKEMTVISAQAPIDKGNEAYAWYDLDLQNNLAYNPKGFEKARIQVIDFIQQICQEQDLDKENIYLGGFSQGGIMTYAVGLTRPDLVKGIIPLSAKLQEETKTGIANESALKDLRIFIAHGQKDQVISIEEARSAKQFLESKGLKVKYQEEVDIAHSINQEIIIELLRWLKKGV